MQSRQLKRASLALAIVGSLVACGGDDNHSKDSGASLPDGGGTSQDSGLPGATDAARDARADAAPVGTAPVLESATLRQTGRFGHDVRIDVVGNDAEGDGVAVLVQLFDANGQGLPVDDSTSGAPDLSPTNVSLDKELAATAHSTSGTTLEGYFRTHPQVKSAKVSVIDDGGNVSSELTVSLVAEPVLQLGSPCDTMYLANRCADGLGCKGTAPATCQQGEAPTITQAGYYLDELGVRVLIAGKDPDDDVNGYTVQFLDTSNMPVSIDVDGDPQTPAESSFTTMVDVSAGNGNFFFRFDPGSDFSDNVKRVRITVSDLGNNNSAPVVKTLNDTDTSPNSTGAPIRTVGAACDARGFDRCPANSVCGVASATATNTTCVQVSTARQRACTAAQVLNPFAGVTSVRGTVKTPSLYDTPDGCATNNPKYQADSVVKLTLTKPVTKLVLSTDHPFTSFDTAVYLLNKCDTAPTLAWCDDQQPSTAMNSSLAVLELSGSFPAQDYYVVIDSSPGSTTGTWQLDVAVTE